MVKVLFDYVISFQLFTEFLVLFQCEWFVNFFVLSCSIIYGFLEKNIQKNAEWGAFILNYRDFEKKKICKKRGLFLSMRIFRKNMQKNDAIFNKKMDQR